MKQENTTSLKLEELLYKKIFTAHGKMLGHVFDMQLSRDGEHRVTALMYGQKSLLFRLHAYGPFSRVFHFTQKPKTIPWEAVEHFDHAAIYLKPGNEPKNDD
jgi:sporulation protein YlmC with PRC-barrel domain